MSTEDYILIFGNNFSEMNRHCQFLNDLRNFSEISMSTKKVVYTLKLMLILDPGGYVQNTNATGVLQDMICSKFLTIEKLMKEHLL